MAICCTSSLARNDATVCPYAYPTSNTVANLIGVLAALVHILLGGWLLGCIHFEQMKRHTSTIEEDDTTLWRAASRRDLIADDKEGAQNTARLGACKRLEYV